MLVFKFHYNWFILFIWICIFRLGDGLRSANRLQALTLLGHVVKRQPTWLIKITNHYLLKELIKLLKVWTVEINLNYCTSLLFYFFQSENEIITITSALLVLNVLLTVIPALIASFLPDIFEGFRYTLLSLLVIL